MQNKDKDPLLKKQEIVPLRELKYEDFPFFQSLPLDGLEVSLFFGYFCYLMSF